MNDDERAILRPQERISELERERDELAGRLRLKCACNFADGKPIEEPPFGTECLYHIEKHRDFERRAKQAEEALQRQGPANPRGYRRLCQTHPDVDYRTQWGCPECVAELREALQRLRIDLRSAAHACGVNAYADPPPGHVDLLLAMVDEYTRQAGRVQELEALVRGASEFAEECFESFERGIVYETNPHDWMDRAADLVWRATTLIAEGKDEE